VINKSASKETTSPRLGLEWFFVLRIDSDVRKDCHIELEPIYLDVTSFILELKLNGIHVSLFDGRRVLVVVQLDSYLLIVPQMLQLLFRVRGWDQPSRR
jgi:hypothetical protein